MQRKIRKKKRGVILLEAIFAMILLGMVSYGFAATSTLQYQQLTAGRVAAQARQYAEVEAKYVQALGYYDVDDGIDEEGVHERKTMESLIGPDEGSKWESETKLVATKRLSGYDDDTRDLDEYKVKVINIDVYKPGESMPRFSLSVPLSLQDSSYGVPVGTVMAWPLASAPVGLHKDHWLECNGQGVDGSKYPRLREHMSSVPDYRGMFLRGLGGNSSSLGTQQGDAIRNITGEIGPVQKVQDGLQRYIGAFAKSPLEGPYGTTFYEVDFDIPVTTSTTDGEGNTSTSTETIHYHLPTANFQDYLIGPFGQGYFSLDFDASRSVPTAEENRPVNKSVRYMIKAK